MKLRYYAAFVTAVLSTIASTALMYMFSNLEVQEMAFLAVLAYWSGGTAVMVATEPRKEDKRGNNRA